MFRLEPISTTNIISIVQVIAVVFGFYFSWQALEANVASFVSAQRAYMYYGGVNSRHIQANGVYTFWIAPLFGNSGNTPTLGLMTHTNCWPDERIENEPFDSPAFLKTEWESGFYGPRFGGGYVLDQHGSGYGDPGWTAPFLFGWRSPLQGFRCPPVPRARYTIRTRI
jgi:hypothetical protein